MEGTGQLEQVETDDWAEQTTPTWRLSSECVCVCACAVLCPWCVLTDHPFGREVSAFRCMVALMWRIVGQTDRRQSVFFVFEFREEDPTGTGRQGFTGFVVSAFCETRFEPHVSELTPCAQCRASGLVWSRYLRPRIAASCLPTCVRLPWPR